MNLLYYTPDRIGAGRLLWQLNKNITDKVRSSLCRNMSELQQKLQKPQKEPTIAILLAASIKDLQGFIDLKPLFHGMRIILILPDREKSTITLGLRLFPRFISYIDGDFMDVAAVLMRIIRNQKGLTMCQN